MLWDSELSRWQWSRIFWIENKTYKRSGSTTSHDYIGDDNRAVMSEEVHKVDPFNTKRVKVKFYDKSMGSPFAGLTQEKVDKFVKRNKKNFERKFSEKLL